MKSLVISCNDELLVALRMSGFEGEFCQDTETLNRVFDEKVKDKNIGMILLGENDFLKIKEKVMKRKEKFRSPLIVTVPGRDGFQEQDFILKYVKEAIGLKLDR